METAWSVQDLRAKLEILSGPLAGIYDSRGMGQIFFAVLAGFAQIERGMMIERTRDGPALTAARSGQSPAARSTTRSRHTMPNKP